MKKVIHLKEVNPNTDASFEYLDQVWVDDGALATRLNQAFDGGIIRCYFCSEYPPHLGRKLNVYAAECLLFFEDGAVTRMHAPQHLYLEHWTRDQIQNPT